MDRHEQPFRRGRILDSWVDPLAMDGQHRSMWVLRSHGNTETLMGIHLDQDLLNFVVVLAGLRRQVSRLSWIVFRDTLLWTFLFYSIQATWFTIQFLNRSPELTIQALFLNSILFGGLLGASALDPNLVFWRFREVISPLYRIVRSSS